MSLSLKAIDRIAAILHERWVSLTKDIAENELISPDRLEGWRELWVTYDELPECEKKRQRRLAVSLLEGLRAFLEAEYAGKNYR